MIEFGQHFRNEDRYRSIVMIPKTEIYFDENQVLQPYLSNINKDEEVMINVDVYNNRRSIS